MGFQGIEHLFFLLLIISTTYGQSGTDVKNLLNQIYTTDSYNKNVRPSANLQNVTNLNIDFFLIGINGINEVEQKMTTTGYLTIQWSDDFFTWTPSSYGGLTTTVVSQKDIWKPDLTLKNGFTKLNELGNDFLLVRIDNLGTVNWSPFEVFETKCEIDTKHFPYDKQSCDIIFGVWTSTIGDVALKLAHKDVYTAFMEKNTEWTIVSTSAKENTGGAESTIEFTLNLQRSASYYVVNIIIPVILLGLLNVFTFVLPAESGEKMGYCITVFLALSVFLSIVSAELPKVSGSIFGYYLIFQVVMGTFVVCSTALELRLHHRKDDLPQKLIQLISCKPIRKNYVKSEETKEDGDKESSKKTWDDFISFMDFWLFWLTLVSHAIGTIAVLGLLRSN